MTHSPEPWAVRNEPSFVLLEDADWRTIWEQWYDCEEHGVKTRKDMERIVACVNALKGIPTELVQLAESAAFINDHEEGPIVIIDCGPPLKSRPNVSFALEEKEPENETP